MKEKTLASERGSFGAGVGGYSSLDRYSSRFEMDSARHAWTFAPREFGRDSLKVYERRKSVRMMPWTSSTHERSFPG